MFGQTWHLTNVLPVIPGFASIYRTSVLKNLKIYVPGLAIEDFNLAFQLRKKKLGIIAHHPSAFATAQDPGNLRDYAKQVRRWNLGFFQTVRLYGIWPSFFWLSLGIFTLEVFSAAIFFIALPVLIFFLILPFFGQIVIPSYLPISAAISNYYITFWDIVFAVFAIDYLFTLFVAIKDKKPILLFYGLGFIFLRILDGLILLTTTPQAFFTKSRGTWVSPKRN